MARKLTAIALVIFTLMVLLGAAAFIDRSGRYSSAIIKTNKTTSVLVGVWQREDNSTQMLLAPDGTGSYRTGQGDQSHFDWNADNKTLNFSEYGDAPTWNLAKLKRILAQDVSMGQSAEIVRLETNRLEIYWAKSERTIRYTKK